MCSRTPSKPVIFVVDDDVSIRESLELLILCKGWCPEIFASASEFLASARRRVSVPSCLVVDVSMPGQSGLELQKRVANDRADMPIIFITGYGDMPMTVEAMKAGAMEFLTRPFTNEALLGAIREAIERSREMLGREGEVQILRGNFASLSQREQEVMALVVTGMLNNQVAAELGFSDAEDESRFPGRPGQHCCQFGLGRGRSA